MKNKFSIIAYLFVASLLFVNCNLPIDDDGLDIPMNVEVKVDFDLLIGDSIGLATQLEIENISEGGTSYEINFGDPNGNNNEISSSNLGIHKHQYSNSGIYSVTINAIDDFGGIADSKSKTIKVTKTINVTFKVNMEQYKYSGIEPLIYGEIQDVNGENQWDSALGLEMLKIPASDDSWEITLPLTNYTAYSYRFLGDNNDDESEGEIPNECGVFSSLLNSNTRFIDLENMDDDISLELVCFNECANCNWECGKVFFDKRDNNKYRTVKIGAECWMAENANINNGLWQCYEDISSKCDEYGKMYFANGLSSICPSGWQIPTNLQWGSFIKSFGLSETLTAGFTIYRGDVNQFSEFGTSGLEVKAGGANNTGSGWRQEGIYSSFWTSEGRDILFDFGVDDIYWNTPGFGPASGSVVSAYCRCLKQ